MDRTSLDFKTGKRATWGDAFVLAEHAISDLSRANGPALRVEIFPEEVRL
jgi:hypothetical protein